MFSKLLHRAHSYAKKTRLLSRGIHALGYGRKRTYRYRKRTRGYGRHTRYGYIPPKYSPSSSSSSSWMPSRRTLGLATGAASGLAALKYTPYGAALSQLPSFLLGKLGR